MNRTRLTRPLAVFATGAVLAIAGAVFGTAGADGVTGTVSGGGSGETIRESDGSYHWAGIINLAVDGGGSIRMYCIDLHTSTQEGVDYTEASWIEGYVPNLALVTWVLNHGYPTVSAASLMTAINETLSPDLSSLSSDQAAAGTQAAVWYFTDGFDLHSSNSREVEAVADYLIDHAVPMSEPMPTLSILPLTLSGTVGERIGPFTVTTSASSVTLSATGAFITDAVGNPLTTVGPGGTFYVTLTSEGSVTVTAETTAVLHSGRVFVTTAPTPKQKLIAASSVNAVASFTVDVDATVATTEAPTTEAPTTEAPTTEAPTTEAPTTEAPTTSDVPTTSAPSDTGGETNSSTPTTDAGSGNPLPGTGSSSTALLAVALGLSMMGGATILMVRRRES